MVGSCVEHNKLVGLLARLQGSTWHSIAQQSTKQLSMAQLLKCKHCLMISEWQRHAGMQRHYAKVPRRSHRRKSSALMGCCSAVLGTRPAPVIAHVYQQHKSSSATSLQHAPTHQQDKAETRSLHVHIQTPSTAKTDRHTRPQTQPPTETHTRITHLHVLDAVCPQLAG